MRSSALPRAAAVMTALTASGHEVFSHQPLSSCASVTTVMIPAQAAANSRAANGGPGGARVANHDAPRSSKVEKALRHATGPGTQHPRSPHSMCRLLALGAGRSEGRRLFCSSFILDIISQIVIATGRYRSSHAPADGDSCRARVATSSNSLLCQSGCLVTPETQRDSWGCVHDRHQQSTQNSNHNETNAVQWIVETRW